jgi:NAD(P)-dependent dehydrogenase (short-subunit alcohol dehydrogenase family)
MVLSAPLALGERSRSAHAMDPSGRFGLGGRVVVITGGAGLLGARHAGAVASAGGVPVVVDLDASRAASVVCACGAGTAIGADITDPAAVQTALTTVLSAYGRVDGLVNNAANNPKVEGDPAAFCALERFTLEQWQRDLDVGLTGAFLCAQAFGTHMAGHGGGTIVNISSEYGMLGPDQRLYRREGAADDEQPVKPVSYSVAKAGLDGMTRWLATYWGDRGVRVNTLTVGGVENGQPAEFVRRAVDRVPLGRMARPDDYEGALIFLLSDASAFMTGANLVVDGGKTTW